MDTGEWIWTMEMLLDVLEGTTHLVLICTECSRVYSYCAHINTAHAYSRRSGIDILVDKLVDGIVEGG